MTMAVVSAGSGYAYLTNQVARNDGPSPDPSLEGYYVRAGEAPGVWYGRGAEVLGVSGEVSEAQMARLYGTGVHPDTAEKLGQAFRVYRPVAERIEAALAAEPDASEQRRRELIRPIERAGERQAVGGFDLTFSPVKSVSTLWAVADDETRAAIEDSVNAAWADTLGWAEDHAVFRTRAGTNGVEYRGVDGVTAAAFTHRSTRSGDPQLHVHVVVANKVQDRHGNWLSLDSAGLHRGVVSMSEHFDTVVERHLADRLGWSFASRPDRPEIREVVGADLGLAREWSQRRQAVERRYEELLGAYRADHGRAAAVAVQRQLAQRATLETRPRKPDGRAWTDERDLWRADAETVTGRPWADLMTSATTGPGDQPEGLDIDSAAGQAIEAVLDRRAVWRVHHLRAEAERLARREQFGSGDAYRAWVDGVVDEGLARSVMVSSPALVSGPEGMTWRDDSFRPSDDLCYTSAEVLSAEAALLAAQEARWAPTVDDTGRAARLEVADPVLSADQVAAVHRLVGEDRWLDVLRGPAGSGKTSTLATVAGAWQDTHGRVVALAPSQMATDALGAGIGADVVMNLAKWDYEGAQDGPLARLQRGDLVVVDEASMAGTLPLARLVAAAGQAGAKVILVGDERQLGAVQAGGAFRLLVERGGCAALDELHRFHSDWAAGADPGLVDAWPDRGAWEAQATLRLATGDLSVIDEYLAAGTITGGTRDDLATRLYERWEADMAAGVDSLMISDRNVEVARLSARARTARVTAGLVDAEGVTLHDDTTAGIGDWVVTRTNDRLLSYNDGRAFVTNGATWTVTARGADGSLTLSNRRHHGVITVPAAYVARSVELAYATTVHRAQGMTVDRAGALLGAETSRELLYVATTRGRESNELYVDTGGRADLDAERPATPERDPYTVLAEVIDRQSAERSVTETIAADSDAQANPATVTARYNHVVSQWTRTTDQVLADAGQGHLAANPLIRAQVTLAEGAGVDAGTFLAGQAGRPGADSPATLAVRLRAHIKTQAPAAGWLAPAPPTAPEAVRDWLATTESVLAGLGAGLAARAAEHNEPWVAAPELGSAGPVDVAQVAAYRAAYGIGDQRCAFGTDTAWGPQADSKTRLERQIGPEDIEESDPAHPGPAQPARKAPEPAGAVVRPRRAPRPAGSRTDPHEVERQRPRPRGPRM